jgi:hypothetical protein
MPTTRQDIGIVGSIGIAMAAMLSGLLVLWSVDVLVEPRRLYVWVGVITWCLATALACKIMLSGEKSLTSVFERGCEIGCVLWAVVWFLSQRISPRLREEVAVARAHGGTQGTLGIVAGAGINDMITVISLVFTVACVIGAVVLRFGRQRRRSSDFVATDGAQAKE